MEEFTISFLYEGQNRKAGVLKKEPAADKERIEYDIRPIAPEIVKKFGEQIRIFKEDGNYTIHKQMDIEESYLDALISAVKKYEQEHPDQ